MKCSFCNANIPDGEKTCPACGAATSLDNVIPAPSPYYKETVGEDLPKPTRRKSKAAAVEPPAPEEVVAKPEPPKAEPPTPVEPAAPAAWETPPQIKSITGDRSNWAIASLVLGLVGLAGFTAPVCCTVLTSIPAIVLGFMSLKSERKGMAVAGIVLGFIGVLMLVVMIIALIFGAVWAQNYQ